MKKLILILALALLLCSCVDGATKIGLDRINWSQSADGLEISWKHFADTPFNAHDYGAVGDGATDDSQAMQDTIDAAYTEYLASGYIQTAYFPPGDYSVNTSRADYTGGDTYGILLQPRPGVRIIGAGMDSTTWIAPDDYRSATRGVSLLFNMNASEFLDGLEIAGITFDNNGDQNLVAYGTSNYTWIGSNNCANVKIHDCKFKDTTGLWCIYLGADVGDTNKNAWIYNNVFENVSTAIAGSISPDHTSIYSNLDNTIIWNNQFDGGAYDAVGSAFELHGNDSRGYGNVIKNYRWGVHVAPNGYSGDSISGISVSDNIIETSTGGVWTWVPLASESVGTVEVSRNLINITDNGTSTYPRAILNYDVDGPISDFIVMDNIIHMYGTSPHAIGIYLAAYKNTSVTGNKIFGATRAGVYNAVGPNFLSGDISQNYIEDCGTSSGSSDWENRSTASITSMPDGKIADGGVMKVNNNQINTAGRYGIVMNAANVTKNSLMDNDITAPTVAEIWTTTSYTDEKMLIDHVAHDYLNSFEYVSDGSRISNPYNWGQYLNGVLHQVTYATDAPTSGYWWVGDVCWHTDGTSGQPVGWVCTATGAPGTWKGMSTTV